MKEKMVIENLSKNGVRVIRRRFYDEQGQITGSTVEADCGCFGLDNRAHTRQRCPRMPKVEPLGRTRGTAK